MLACQYGSLPELTKSQAFVVGTRVAVPELAFDIVDTRGTVPEYMTTGSS